MQGSVLRLSENQLRLELLARISFSYASMSQPLRCSSIAPRIAKALAHEAKVEDRHLTGISLAYLSLVRTLLFSLLI